MTGGRIKRIKDFVKDQTFMLTYGDGVGDVNLKELVKFHQSQGKYATVTAVKPPSKFGALVLNERNRLVRRFTEKPEDSETWVNGGFFVLEPEVFDYIEGDKTSWEREPLEKLALEGQLVAYKHRGFWQCVDTLRDKDELTAIWNSGHAPWGAWKS
jgi:glucose-1-phosphate cytidylyltransferase